MLLGLVADSHDNVPALEAAASAFASARVAFVLHAGDVCDPSALFALAAFPGVVVAGNNDDVASLRAGAPSSLRVEEVWEATFEGVRVGLVHGHDRGALARLVASRPAIVVHGHSHRVRDERIDGVRFVNPGALSRAREYSAAILEVPSGALRAVAIAKAARGF